MTNPLTPSATAAAPEGDVEALKAAQAALLNVREVVSAGALTGFNHADGDWAERLFNSQQQTSRAIRTVAVALAASRSPAASGAADGFVLVPREPTIGMLARFAEVAWPDFSTANRLQPMRDAYAAMLAAAPPAPPAEPDAGVRDETISRLQSEVAILRDERDERAGAAALNLAALKQWQKRAAAAEAALDAPSNPQLASPELGARLAETLNDIDVHEEAGDYELRADGDYKPNEFEQQLLEDFGAGLLAKVREAIAGHLAVPTPRPDPEPRPADDEGLKKAFDKLDGDSLDYIIEVIGAPRAYNDGKGAMRDWFLGRLRRLWNLPEHVLTASPGNKPAGDA